MMYSDFEVAVIRQLQPIRQIDGLNQLGQVNLAF
jgi:hypothetical protein